jgi:hypothetical protein
MHYRTEGDQAESRRAYLGVRSKVQDLNKPINFSDPR